MGEAELQGRGHGSRIPLGIKLLYTAFMAVLIPYYWTWYGPVNFLWFCDVALLGTLVALWLENRLLASMQAVAITLPQMLWIVDFLSRLLAGDKVFIGQTEYMFDSARPLFLRGLSFFHFWLPLLLLWLVWRLGYDRRALVAQTLVAWVVLSLSYALTHGPDNPAGNVNNVYGPYADRTQTWMAAPAWLALLMLAYPVCIYLPTHLVFCWVYRRKPAHPV